MASATVAVASSQSGGDSAAPSGAMVYETSSPLQVIGVQDSTPIAWRSDGSALAYVSGNYSIFILAPVDASGRLEVRQILNGHSAPVRSLIFHPTNPDTLVSAGVDGIFVWSLASGRTVKEIRSEGNVSPEFPAHESDVEVLAFAFNNTLISGSKDSNIKIWDADRGYTLLETVTGHKAAVLCLKVHPKTQRLASAGRDSTIKVWDISTLAPEWRARRADDRGIKCTLKGNLEGHRGDVVAITWRPSGTGLYSGARDNTLRLWNVDQFSEVRIIEDAARGMDGSHKGDVRRIIGLPGNNYAVTASMDGTVVVWEVDKDDGSDELASAAEAAAASGVVAGVGGESEGKEGEEASAAAASSSSSSSSSSAAADDGATSMSGSAMGAGQWDAGTAAILEAIMGGDNSAATQAAAPGIVAQSSDKILGQSQLFPFEEGIFALELCPRTMQVAVSTARNSVAIYQFSPSVVTLLGYDPADPHADTSARTGRVHLPRLQVFHGHSAQVHGVEMLSRPAEAMSGASADATDRYIATCSDDNRVCVYDAATTTRLVALDFTSSALCLAVATLPEMGPVLFAAGTDYVIRAYGGDPARHAALQRFLEDESVRSGRHGEVQPERLELARYEGHAGRIRALAVHPKGTVMVSAAQDFTVLLWDLQRPRLALIAPGAPRREGVPRGAPVARIEAHMGHVTSIAFCSMGLRGGDLVAMGGNDHAVSVWKLASGALGGRTLVQEWLGGDEGDEGRLSSGGSSSSSSSSSSGVGDEAVGAESPAHPVVAAGPGPHRSTVSAVAWGRGPSSGLLFTAGWDHKVCVWAGEAAGGASAVVPLAARTLHGARVTDMDVSSDGRFLVTVSADFSARQWTASKELRAVARFPCSALDGGLTSVAAGYSRFFTASESGQIRIFPLYSPVDPSAGSRFMLVRDEAQEAEKPTTGAGGAVPTSLALKAGGVTGGLTNPTAAAPASAAAAAGVSSGGAGITKGAFIANNPVAKAALAPTTVATPAKTDA